MDTKLLSIKFTDLGTAFYELRNQPADERTVEQMGLYDEAGQCVAMAWECGALREIKGLGDRVKFHCVDQTTESEKRQMSHVVRCPASLWVELVGYDFLVGSKLQPGLLSSVAPFPELEFAHTARKWSLRHDKFACDVLAAILGNDYMPPMTKETVRQQLQVSETTLRRLLNEGRLPHLVISAKIIRPRRDVMDELIKSAERST